jgi:hypothetical protein
MMSFSVGLVQFLAVCAATSFVCTEIKEDEDERLGRSTARLFVLMSGGILAFALLVQFFTGRAS